MGMQVIRRWDSEPFTAEIDGHVVECESLADALTLTIAEATVAAGSFALDDPSPRQLIAVARKYRFNAIAIAIEAMS